MLIPLYHLRFESYGFHSLVLHTEFVITVRDLFSRSTLFNHICRLPGWRKVHTSLYASHILWPRCVLTHKHAVMDTTCSQFARTRNCFCICTYFHFFKHVFPIQQCSMQCIQGKMPKTAAVFICVTLLSYSNALRNASRELVICSQHLWRAWRSPAQLLASNNQHCTQRMFMGARVCLRNTHANKCVT